MQTLIYSNDFALSSALDSFIKSHATMPMRSPQEAFPEPTGEGKLIPSTKFVQILA